MNDTNSTQTIETEDYWQQIQQIFSNISAVEIIFTLTVPIAMVVSAGACFKLWLKFNLLFSLLYGFTMILYPEALLSITFNGELDLALRLVASLYGCYEIFGSFFILFMLPSKDESIFITFLWSNIIKYTLILTDNYISVKSGTLWNHKLLLLSGLSCVFIALTSVYFLLKSSPKRSQFHYKMYPINRVAKIDFYMLFIIGLVCYAYPNYLLNGLSLNDINDGHIALFRIGAGIVIFSFAMNSFAMPSFLFEKDKLRFIQSRLAGGLFELSIICYGHFYLGALKYEGFRTLAIGNVIYDLFISYAYYMCCKKIAELRVQANLNTSTPLNDSELIYTEVSTTVIEEIKEAVDMHEEECNKKK